MEEAGVLRPHKIETIAANTLNTPIFVSCPTNLGYFNQVLQHVAQFEFSRSVIVRVNSCEFVDRLLGRRESDPRIHTNKMPIHGAAIHDKLRRTFSVFDQIS